MNEKTLKETIVETRKEIQDLQSMCSHCSAHLKEIYESLYEHKRPEWCSCAMADWAFSCWEQPINDCIGCSWLKTPKWCNSKIFPLTNGCGLLCNGCDYQKYKCFNCDFFKEKTTPVL